MSFFLIPQPAIAITSSIDNNHRKHVLRSHSQPLEKATISLLATYLQTSSPKSNSFGLFIVIPQPAIAITSSIGNNHRKHVLRSHSHPFEKATISLLATYLQTSSPKGNSFGLFIVIPQPAIAIAQSIGNNHWKQVPRSHSHPFEKATISLLVQQGGNRATL
ncbi:hypothetical protein V2H45_24825 [Tumidithrix elongata RA019]|uniref:Uncharacterized protein n=1 Tax=Tumidithrix elongata BACA0141 TaxID=2716417 RepID=A0AAW9Q8Z1_9CYAN|nr:hypothetical protein [Tumidithrix elongata RA019]